MDAIMIGSEAYKELMESLKRIECYVLERSSSAESLDEMWVDSYAVCQYLQISERTLQRLRSKGEIPYSNLGGKTIIRLALSSGPLNHGRSNAAKTNSWNFVPIMKGFVEPLKSDSHASGERILRYLDAADHGFAGTH